MLLRGLCDLSSRQRLGCFLSRLASVLAGFLASFHDHSGDPLEIGAHSGHELGVGVWSVAGHKS